ncbi:LacI family DNA-binding transcriptional regulator [Thermosipho ferrireducens]|uniref:LacI family DNA-binding transcriptional regulator n=1 Tax=Thermosipho ferrireducens TaxID=2571116 RepID=A0ABX7S7H8_9BACT|nr:LacI family DNA-binding transcriptional regulator [Thermosipho ferrireducens]QTA37218.1 LacI family DNA-binding transcriptional regulator [Thermosipho ferrireducens]
MKIKDIAKLAGVSVATVSRVFNDPEKVKPETRKKVLKVVESVGYSPHAVAKFLRTKETGLYALTVMGTVEDVFEDTYSTKFLKGAVEYFSKHGKKIVIDVYSGENILEYYKSIVNSKLFEGVILLDIVDNDPRIDYLKSTNFPFVCVGQNNKNNFIYVDTDNVTGGFLAGKHLYEIGCKKVLYIGGYAELPFERLRLAGFKDACKKFGMKCEIEYANFKEQMVHDIIERYISDNRFLFQGIFCDSDIMAYTAYISLKNYGIDVPVVGFDNIRLSEIASITTIDQNIMLVGYKVAEKLHKLSLGKEVKSEIVPVKLVIRNNTAVFLNL